MLKALFACLLALNILGTTPILAQQRSTTLLQDIAEDHVFISTDNPAYFPDDTLRLVIQRDDSTTAVTVVPIVAIEGMKLEPSGAGTHVAVIPHTVTPEWYRILRYCLMHSPAIRLSTATPAQCRDCIS